MHHQTRAEARARRLAAVAIVTLCVVVGGRPIAAQDPAAGTVVLDTSDQVSQGGTLTTTALGLDRTPDGAPTGTTERPGWTTVVAVPAGTQQLALSWTGDPRAEFEVRTRVAGSGAWSAATTLAGEPDEAPEGVGARPGAGPLWLGSKGVSSVELRLVEGLVADVEVDAMTWRSAGAATNAVTIAKPATPAGGPPLRVRSSWAPGGWVRNPGCSPAPTVNPTLEHAVVHHTETPNAYTQADVPGILAGIYRYHTVNQGWCDIAYNFFVDRYGGVWEGRSGGIDEAVEGGHARGFNTRSVGVALIGTYDRAGSFPAITPTAVELTALRDVLAWKLGSQGIDPKATVQVVTTGNARFAAGATVALPAIGGHGDNGFTSCPGDLVRPRLAQLRLDVAARIAATNNAARWAPHASGAAYFRQVLVDSELYLDRPSRIGTYTSRVVRAGAAQGELTASIVISTRTDARIGVVDRFYRSAFGRLPDSAGLAANVRHRDTGTSTRDLAAAFLRSANFTATYGTPSDAEFVRILYRNAFGREPSASNLAHWVGLLDDGMARQDVLVSISESPEHRNRVAAGNRTTEAFYVMLRRAPSAASYAYWTPRLGSGTTGNRDLVVALLRSPEYLGRF